MSKAMRFTKVDNGFKQTDVGMIPDDWEVRTLLSVASLERGKFTARPRNDPRYYGGNIPFIQTGDVTKSNGKINSYSQTLNQEGLKVSKMFPAGTLFFTIAANIGDVGFSSFDTACPDSLVAITPNNRVNKFWLFHELRSRKRSFESLATHNAQLNINLEKLRPYLLPLPSNKAEQEAIAEALSDADALIESLEQLIAKKRQIKQGAMQELLTGKRRLPGFGSQAPNVETEVGVIPKDWEIKTIGQVSAVGRGRVISHREISRAFSPRFPVHSSQTSNNGVMGYLDTYEFDGEYITWTTDGANAGTVFHRNGRFNCTNVCGTIKLKSDDHLFVSMVLGGFAFRHVSRHLGNPKLMNDVMKMVKIPLPSTKAEQEAIAKLLSDMGTEIAALEAKLAKTRQIKQGMMQELLTGRIRLV